MTAAEFLAWDPPDGSDRWELVDGTPEAMAPASDRHGAIQAEAARLLGNHLVGARPDCRVIVESGTKTNDYNIRVPDLSVTCGPIDPDARLGEPVLVIEILSPSNSKRTWANVTAYITVTSIVEVLVLHATEIDAELLRRGRDGGWALTPLIAGDTITLASIGFTGPVDAFWRTVTR
jgi:Uma2 family endonuclease